VGVSWTEGRGGFGEDDVVIYDGGISDVLLDELEDPSVRLGHENVATTMNLYRRIPLDTARESARSVADHILG
jgi:hypothetical protein